MGNYFLTTPFIIFKETILTGFWWILMGICKDCVFGNTFKLQQQINSFDF